MDANERLSFLMRHTPDGLFWLQERGGLLDANPPAVRCLGANGLEEILGRPFLGPDGLLPRLPDWSLSAATGETIPPFCYSGPSAFLKHVELEIHAAATGESGSDVPTWLIFCSDLSERKRAEQSIVQREKLSALDGIIAGVAHELNNPMTAILGYTELLLHKGLDEKIHSRLARIAQETERCRKIVGSMLTYAERNKAPLVPEPLNEALEEVILLSAYQLRVDDIDLTFRLDPAIPKFPMQREALQRAFLHIINNAHLALLQTSGRERNLIIESTHKGDAALIRFRDSGTGIPGGNLARVFDPFFTTRAVGEGMGLGLSTALGIVKDHNGQIWAESVPGLETSISIEIPYAPQSGDRPAERT